MLSSLYDKQFYEKSINVTNKTRKVKAFQAEKVNEDFNINDFKSDCSKKGIHVYDVKLVSDTFQSSKNAKLEYKIRRNEDVKDFDSKYKQIEDGLKKKGMEIKEKAVDTKKPM